MISSQTLVLIVEAKQPLVLTEISAPDKERILNFPEGLIGYLIAYLPEECMSVKLETTTLVKIVDLENAVGLMSPDSGIRVVLIKQADPV